MLAAHRLSKSFGIQPLLEAISFSINAGDRIGLIGPNGSGKSTLLKILAGKIIPDNGSITRAPRTLRIGYLAQGFGYDLNLSIEELIGQASGDPEILEGELSRIGILLAESPEDDELQGAYDRVVTRMTLYDVVRMESIVHSLGLESIVHSLGLSDIPKKRPLSKLSGGQKTRLSLALVLLDDPQFLLLDEPTNHLDIGMLEWLEEWLANFNGAALIVSHDRTFLNHTVRQIFDLDPTSHKIRTYKGNYSDYLQQYIANKEAASSSFKDQLDEIRRMKRDIAITKQQAKRVEMTTTPRQPGVRRIAKKVASKAKAREKKLDRYLSSDERIEKPKTGWQLKLEFQEAHHLGRNVIEFEDVSIGYNKANPLLYIDNLLVQAGERIAITGKNGAGKTTLFKTIIGELNSLSGKIHIGASVNLGYMAQEQELLDKSSTALKCVQLVSNMNLTETRSFLHFFLFEGDDSLRAIGELSFGERSRLELAILVASGSNVLLLDEPINHLDIPSRERFEQALSNYPGTILAIVHDRYFIQRFATNIWLVDDGQVVTSFT
jgi:ATP-binding cassette subfamily F protein 3